MTQEQLRAVLREITYKDWRLVYNEAGHYIQWHFETRTELPGEAPFTQSWHGRKWRVSVHMVASELIQTCFMAALAAEEHEAREAFHYRGVAVLGPHWDLEQVAHDILSGRRRESVRPEPVLA